MEPKSAEQLLKAKSLFAPMPGGKSLSLAGCALLFLWVMILFLTYTPLAEAAATSGTVILPLKINTPDDRENLTEKADGALLQVLLSSSSRQEAFKLLPRVQAESIFDYSRTWPPTTEEIRDFGSKAGPSIHFIAAGSLTKLGDTISIDMKVFDLLDPSAPKFYYLEGQELVGLEQSLTELTNEILAYTSSSFVIASIAPEGNKRIDSGAILRAITSRSGDIYEPEKLREDLKAIFKMGYFDDVRLKVEDSRGGKNVIFEVKEKPVIGQVLISGQDELDEKDIREVISIVPNTIFNPNRAREAEENIRNLYKSKGFYNTQVTSELSYPKQEQINIHFRIDEGEKVYIKEIRFVGNETFKDKELLKVMGTKKKGLLSWFTDSGVLKREILDQDAARITAFYHHHGFIEAMVSKPKITQEGEWLYITIDVSEGNRYRVGNIDLSGDLIDTKEELIALLESKPGEYLSRNTLRQDVLRLNDHYAEHGYAFAEATPSIKTNKEESLVDISIHVIKGDLVYINRIMIQGNDRTRDKVIRREMLIKEGGVFDSTALRKSHQKLQRLEYFEEVSITPEPTADKTKMDMIVDLKEKPTGAFSVGAGYSSIDDLLFMAEISQNNFLGRGQRLALSASVSGTSARYNLSFDEPHFYDTQLLVGGDVYNWEREYDTYTRDSKGVTVRFGYPIWEEWKMSFSYGLDDTSLYDVNPFLADPSIIESMNINLTSFVILSFTRDTRNKTFGTTSGSLNALSVEYAGGPLQGDSQFAKVLGTSSWFFPAPIIEDTAFHFKFSAGQVWELETDKLPDFEKFYLGGINSVRGFKARTIAVDKSSLLHPHYEVGGEIYWYANVEYLFPLVKQGGLRGVVFFDAGNVYDNKWDFADLKKSVGAGLRWLSPMGPMRLEWAYVLDPEPDEDTSNWEFSIGGAF